MVKTFFAFIYFISSMILLLPFGLIAITFYILGLRKPMKHFIYRIAQGWALTSIMVSGCKVDVTGRENIPKKGGVCFVSNHDGYFDIVLLLAYCGRPFGFVAKKELLLVPVLNAWIYLLGGLFIDRKNVKNAVLTINKGIKRIKSGNSMIIFPEGHRSKGRGLLPFHAGSLKLATMADAPIIPIAIKGSYDVFEKNYRFMSSQIKISFMEPVSTADLPSEQRKFLLCDRIFSVIKRELNI
jgi:1-acyl-sn-glycerol-3-phosphate acyltransferase